MPGGLRADEAPDRIVGYLVIGALAVWLHNRCHKIQLAQVLAELGVEIIGTTLAGYTGARPNTDGPDLELLGELTGASKG